MRVNVISRARASLGVTHERIPHVLDHTRLHESSVEGVAQVLEQDRSYAGATDRRVPRPAKFSDWFAVVGEEQASCWHALQRFSHSAGQRNFSLLAACGLAPGDAENSSVKVYIFGALGEQFCLRRAASLLTS